MPCQIIANNQHNKMFKLCVFVALLSLVAAAPAPAPAPGLLHPGLVAGPWLGGPLLAPPLVHAPLVHAPLLAHPHVVSVVPGAVSSIAVHQTHPSPVLVKHLW